MRISTSLVAAAVAGGTLSLAFQAAEVSQQPSLPQSEGLTTPVDATQSPGEASNPAPSQSQSPQPSSSANSSAGDQTKPSTTPSPTKTAPVVKTVDSDPINYKYGVVQIELTATNNKITKIVLLQGDASYGRDAAYAALIDATIQVQGTNYGNVSGATFTTEAFKKAVENAISKL